MATRFLWAQKCNMKRNLRTLSCSGSVESINCGTRRSLNWDYGSYRAISIAKFSKVETLSLAPIICLF